MSELFKIQRQTGISVGTLHETYEWELKETS